LQCINPAITKQTRWNWMRKADQAGLAGGCTGQSRPARLGIQAGRKQALVMLVVLPKKLLSFTSSLVDSPLLASAWKDGSHICWPSVSYS
jgi:hypothetical protein